MSALAILALSPGADAPLAAVEPPRLITGALPPVELRPLPPALGTETALSEEPALPANVRVAQIQPAPETVRSATPPSVVDAPAPTTVASAPATPVEARPESPAVRLRLPEAERRFVARMDALLQPSRSRVVPVDDAVRVRDAFANASNVAAVRALRDEIKDPIARKLVEWSLLRNGAGTAREVRAFLAANPDWPNRDLMNQRAEEHVFMAGGSAREIKAFFADQEPRTAIGWAALASAHLAEQDEASATRFAARAWREGDIPTMLETGFLERFGRLLTAEDHKWRLDRLLLDDLRWEGDRKDRVAVMRRVLPFLSEAERAKANARIAVFLRNSADANKLMAALPADAATKPVADWGFAFQLAQWHRRGDRHGEARAILLAAPTDPALAVSLDDWWEERRLSAYEALKAGLPQMAYDLVKSPGTLGVNARKDAAFLAGWIAKRHLDDAKLAEPHFRALAEAADGPLSRGKAGYWLARTYEALGDKDKVRPSLEAAARNVDTFYGHLAMQELEPGRTRLPMPAPQMPSDEQARAFNGRDAVQAVVVARRAGLDQSVTRGFLAHLRNTLTTEPEHAMIAHLAEAIGDTQMALRVAKTSVARGMNMTFYAYPIHAMPAYTPLRPPPEPAFLLAIARQESEFNISTKSGAGARGLLQVMPITANHVCRDYKISKCEIDRLSTDPAYNARMASAYIADRMDEFTGSYVLTLAGYNAGPGRTRQWIREFGDPRDPKVDPIDWIHRIPFEETREYVQKVLSNIQVYRARLGDEANALRVGEDLRRNAPPTRRASTDP